MTESFIKSTENQQKQNTVIAYISSSYDEYLRKYSFGCVIITPEEDTIIEFNCDNQATYIYSINIAGEIIGAMFAINWTKNHRYDSLIIRNSYEGLGKWSSGEWTPNSYASIEYLDFYKKNKDFININYENVDADDTYKKSACDLAKKGLTLNKKKEVNFGDGCYNVKGVTADEIDTIIQLMSEEYTDLKVNKDIKDIYKLKLGKDRLIIHIYNTGITTIIGKAHMIFHNFISYISQLIDDSEIVCVLNKCFKISIDKNDIEKQYKEFLPNLPDDINIKMKNSLLQSIYNLNFTGEMYDFTYLLHPIFRVLEGHLKYIILINNIPCDNDKFTCFHKYDDINFELISDHHKYINNKDMIKYLNKIYNYYFKNRHSLFHWDAPINRSVDSTRQINNKNEADDIIRNTLLLINEYYLF